MKFFAIVFVIIGTFLVSTRQAGAIVFLPALILIPIAKIVAIVITGLSLPAISIGAMYSYLFKKSLQRTMLTIFGIILILAAIAAVLLKFSNPDRPLL